MKRALQAAHISFAFSPRCGTWSVLGASAPQRDQLSVAFMLHLPLIMARGSSGPADYSARPERASLSFAFLLYWSPLWCAARPRSERSVGGPVIFSLLFHLPTFMAPGPSGPPYRLPICSICPRYGARPSGPAYRLPFCSICSCYGAQPKLASLSLAVLPNLLPLWRAASRPAYHCLPAEYTARLERESLSFAVLPNLLPLWHAARAASLSLPCCSIYSAARASQLIICAARAGHLIICAAGAGQFVICPYALCLLCGARRSV